MLYQDVLHGSIPYVARKTHISHYRLHFHHEIEILYCLSGGFTATVNGVAHKVRTGEMLFVGSMKPHEIKDSDDAEVFLIEFGPALLGEHFAAVTSVDFEVPVLSASKTHGNNEIFTSLEELVSVPDGYDAENELLHLSALYKLCASLLSAGKTADTGIANCRADAEMEKALSLIYTDYHREITVDEVAALTGYGKSNFCKLFKKLMGMSFHAYLNGFRIENAKYLLRSSSSPVSEIGAAVGLPDPKTFSRLFKENTGVTPNRYRKGE